MTLQRVAKKIRHGEVANRLENFVCIILSTSA